MFLESLEFEVFYQSYAQALESTSLSISSFLENWCENFNYKVPN